MGQKVLFDNKPYMQAWEETHGGNRFTYVRVGNGVAVIPIKRTARHWLELTLIREPRLETCEPILKTVGGYLRGCPQEETAHRLLREEAGIAYADLRLLIPKMEGFTVVELPIATYLALNWQVVDNVTAELCPIPVEEATKLVLEQKIPDQCAADAIMRIALLEARGRLPI